MRIGGLAWLSSNRSVAELGDRTHWVCEFPDEVDDAARRRIRQPPRDLGVISA
jgi:hypothetical protein